MKAQELMIGDWVMKTDFDGNPVAPYQIDWIRTGEVGLLWNVITTPPLITPIPLTAEILEKNEFVEEGNLEEGMWFRHPQWNLTLSFYEVWDVVDIVLGNEIGFCEISFVHQLQHTLRLCGLTELADNFKID